MYPVRATLQIVSRDSLFVEDSETYVIFIAEATTSSAFSTSQIDCGFDADSELNDAVFQILKMNHWYKEEYKSYLQV
jgi:hypothetical protein